MFKRSKPKVEPDQPQPAEQPPGRAGIGLRVYTSTYVITGRVAPEGPLIGWLNIANKRVLVLEQARSLPLAPDTPLKSAAFPQVTVPKQQIHAVEVLDGLQAIRLEPRQVPALLYTERFVIRADLRLPAQAPAERFPNLLGGVFFTVSNAQLHPIIPTQPLENQDAAILILNRERIHFYHPV